MPFQSVPNAVQAQIIGTVDNQMVMNDLYFIGPTANPTFAELITLSGVLLDFVTLGLVPNLNEAYTGSKLVLKSLAVLGGPQTVAGFSTVGGVSGEAAPNNVAPCITFAAEQGGRSGRGRNYIPAVSNSHIDGNTIDPTWRGSIEGTYGELLFGGIYDPAPFVWSIVSRYTGGALRPLGTSFPVAVAFFNDNIVDSQRRRLPGRGR